MARLSVVLALFLAALVHAAPILYRDIDTSGHLTPVALAARHEGHSETPVDSPVNNGSTLPSATEEPIPSATQSTGAEEPVPSSTIPGEEGEGDGCEEGTEDPEAPVPSTPEEPPTVPEEPSPRSESSPVEPYPPSPPSESDPVEPESPTPSGGVESPAPTGNTGGGFVRQNGAKAQSLNQEFGSLTADTPCTDGSSACVEGAFAQCVGGKYVLQPCSGGLTCAALPLVNKEGTSVTCTTEADRDARISAALEG